MPSTIDMHITNPLDLCVILSTGILTDRAPGNSSFSTGDVTWYGKLFTNTVLEGFGGSVLKGYNVSAWLYVYKQYTVTLNYIDGLASKSYNYILLNAQEKIILH